LICCGVSKHLDIFKKKLHNFETPFFRETRREDKGGRREGTEDDANVIEAED
jgi:hypothetical protein